MKSIDGDRLRRAIRTAESETSARIAVHVSHGRVDDAFEKARTAFHDARLHEHPDGRAVLFLLAPKARSFAVYASDAIHRALGDTFWQTLIAEMKPYFARGDLTGGLEHGLSRAGDELRARLPAGQG